MREIVGEDRNPSVPTLFDNEGPDGMLIDERAIEGDPETVSVGACFFENGPEVLGRRGQIGCRVHN